MDVNIGSFLARRADISPDREAYVDSATGFRLSFAALNQRVNQLAHQLRSQGVVQGDRVALCLMNSAEFIESFLAVAKAGGVVIARLEPAVVQHETLCPKRNGAVGDGGQGSKGVVEIDRLPAVVMHRAGCVGLRPRHDAVAQVTLETDGAAVQAGVGIGRVKRRSLEPGAGQGVAGSGVAELDLAAAVGQFLGQHAVTAGPAVVQGVRLSTRIGATAGGQDDRGEVFVPGAPGAVVAGADTGGPERRDGLEFVAPAPRKVDHLVGQLRAGQDGGGEPVTQDGRLAVQRRAGGDDAGRGVGGKAEGQGQAEVLVRVGERQGVGALGPGLGEDGAQGRAILAAHVKARLPRKGRRGLRTQCDQRVCVQHTARQVDFGSGGNRAKVGPVRQPRTPIGAMRQTVRGGGQNDRLATGIKTIVGHLLDGSEGEASDEVLLHQKEHRDRGQGGDDGPGRDQMPRGDPLAVER